jgi:hypothetical protein
MPLYKVLQQSFVNGRLVSEGELVEYDGDVHDNLELVKKGSKAKPDADPDPEMNQSSFNDAPTGV